MNSKEISSNKKSSSTHNTISNKNAGPTDNHSKTESSNDSNYPFYTPPGEGPKPRITSN